MDKQILQQLADIQKAITTALHGQGFSSCHSRVGGNLNLLMHKNENSNDKKLNRTKIKNLIKKIKEDINPKSEMGLFARNCFNNIEKSALRTGTNDDVKRIEKLFIKIKLYPLTYV